MILPAGKLRRVHINGHKIRSNINAASESREPVVTVREGKGIVRRCKRLEIDGPSVVVYSPDKPLSCGARVWIETRSALKLDEAGDSPPK